MVAFDIWSARMLLANTTCAGSKSVETGRTNGGPRWLSVDASPNVLSLVVWSMPAVLLAFGCRMHTLGLESLWLDEGFTYQISRLSPPSILATLATADNHPPLHYLLLWGWMNLIGSSEFAMRMLSVVCGVLTVAIVARLGARLFGPTVGLSAALLLAVSPFHIWYSQEARMYALLCLMAVGAMAAYARAFQHGSRRWWVAVAVLDALAMYSHYYGFFVLVAQALFALVISVQQRAVRWRGTALAVALAGLAYAPWLPAIWQQYQRAPHDYAPLLGIHEVLRKMAGAFAIGELPPAGFEPLVWILAAFVVLGMIPLGSSSLAGWTGAATPQVRMGALLLGIWIVSILFVPYVLAAIFAIDLRISGQTYYIAAVPAYYLLAGRGVTLFGSAVARTVPGLRKRPSIASAAVAGIVLVAMLAVVWLALTHQFLNRRNEDFRGAVQYIAEHEWPGDTIILHAEHIHYPFDYYYRGALQWHRSIVGDDAVVDAALRQMTAGSERVWLVLSHDFVTDPEGRVDSWLQRHGLLVDERWLNGVKVVAYSLEAHPNYRPMKTGQPLSVEFGGVVRLIGAQLPETVESGTVARIKLNWLVLGQADEDYHAVLLLEDAQGQVWSRLDKIPIAGAYPSTHWQRGEYLEDRYPLPIPIGTPPGEYRLRAFLYAPSTGQPLSVADGNAHPFLGTIRIDRATPLTVRRELARLGFGSGRALTEDMRLINGRCDPVDVKPGETLRCELLWQMAHATGRSYDMVIQLSDATGKVKVEQTGLSLGGSYSSSRWQEGEVVRDWHDIKLPPDLEPGEYRVLVGLVDGNREPGSMAEVGRTTVVPLERLTQRPPVRFEQSAVLGDCIALVGFDLDGHVTTLGGEVRLTLYWEALGTVDASYTVFTHVLAPDNRVIGQRDNIPVGGDRPTTTWAKGEYIVDEYSIPIEPGVSVGEYLIEVGMYLPSSGERLRIGAEDRIVLTEGIRVRDE